MEKRCYGCMQIKEQSPICEHCGFNENIENLPHQLPLGTVLLEQYVVGKALGQGRSGITYIGLDLNLDAPVAIKEYYPAGVQERDCSVSLEVTCEGSAQQEKFRQGKERFIEEARALGKFVDTPQIIHVYNYFEANNTSYTITDHVKGVSLKTYVNMRGGKLTPKETFRIMQPVMDAMEKIHEDGLVHRGIRPDNIMIQFGGAAKLLELGGVVQQKKASGETDTEKAAFSRSFAPAEQYQSEGNMGPWTDMYALCATMYYCMTGQAPVDALTRKKKNVHPDWNSIPDLTQAQMAALEKGMALSEMERIGSVGMFRKAISGQQVVLKEEKKESAKEEPKPKKQGKKPLPLILAGVAAVAVIAVAAVFAMGRKDAEPVQVEAEQTTAATQATETEPVVTEPEWEPAVARAGYGEAVYSYLDAGTQVRIVGRVDDYYVIEQEALDLLVYQEYVRLDDEEEYAFWDGYSKNNIQVYDNGMLEGDPIAILRKNTEVRVRDGKGGWLRIEWNENEGYVSNDSISQWYVSSKAAAEPDVMLMGNYYGPVQDGDMAACDGEIIADGTKAYITLLLREDEVKVTDYDEDVAVIWIEGELFAEVPRGILALEGEGEYETWTGYSKWDGVIYAEYQLRNELEKLYTNKEVTVLDELPECYVVEYEGKLGYMLKDKVSETKIRSSSSGGGDVVYGGGGGGGGGGGVIWN